MTSMTSHQTTGIMDATGVQIGGTANIKAIDDTRFIVAMTGRFDGGVFAEIAGSEKQPDGSIAYTLRHYFMNQDGSYVFTQDTSVHRPLGDGRVYAQTTYNVIETGGHFSGLTGSFKSWGTIDYDAGVGTLRFEGELTR